MCVYTTIWNIQFLFYLNDSYQVLGSGKRVNQGNNTPDVMGHIEST